MAGNVSEWVADWFGPTSAEADNNPSGPPTGSEKVLKGCSWFFQPAYCRGMTRASVEPETRFDYFGFRCVVPVIEDNPGRTEMALNPIAVPSSHPPAMDGAFSAGEWDGAVTDLFADGSQLFLMHNAEFLYVGIRVNEPRMVAGNVYLWQDEKISVLHSSAALGTAIYQEADPTWQMIQDFSWRCRGTGNSESDQAEREAFLQEDGWLAANGRMGNPNEFEYKIKIPDQDFRLAVVFTRSTYPYEKVPWPGNLEDACIQPTPRGFPEFMDFSPDQWRVLVFAGPDD
jgi:hypothetical protein